MLSVPLSASAAGKSEASNGSAAKADIARIRDMARETIPVTKYFFDFFINNLPIIILFPEFGGIINLSHKLITRVMGILWCTNPSFYNYYIMNE